MHHTCCVAFVADEARFGHSRANLFPENIATHWYCQAMGRDIRRGPSKYIAQLSCCAWATMPPLYAAFNIPITDFNALRTDLYIILVNINNKSRRIGCKSVKLGVTFSLSQLFYFKLFFVAFRFKIAFSLL